MANAQSIATELAAIMKAVYGEEVRTSIHDAIQKMWNDLDYAVQHQLIDVDTSLSQSGSGADAAAVGSKFAKAFLNQGDLASGADLNNCTNSGFYRLVGSRVSSYSNKPDGYTTAGLLVVYQMENYIYQKLYHYSGSQSLTQKNYARRYYPESSTWSAWIQNIDDTLTVEGRAADSAAVGNAITRIQNSMLALDTTLTETGKAADAKIVGDELSEIRSIISYVPIEITSASVYPAVVELGATLTTVPITYACNAVPVSLTINNVSYTPLKNATVDVTGLSMNETTAFTIKAKDAGAPGISAKTATRTVTVYFYNSIYWGVAAIPETIDQTFIKGLASSTMSDEKARTISVNGGSPRNGRYVWYASPVRLGTCTFKSGGFEGGFEAPITVSVTNGQNHTENYYLYRSTNDGLGVTDIIVS